MRFVLLILTLLSSPAVAFEDVVADLDKHSVAITTDFDGSDIFVFGAVRRDAPIPQDAANMEVIVTVEGPSEPVVVRRKERRFGIWVNTDAVEIDTAPSFYAVASSAPLDLALSQTEDERHAVSINKAIRAVGVTTEEVDGQDFTQALVRIRENTGSYQLAESAISVSQETLFSTEITLPANLVEGEYNVRIFLTRGGEVTATFEDVINVQKVGLERWIYNLAHERPLIYGLLSLFIAIAAGWAASAVFRLVRLN